MRIGRDYLRVSAGVFISTGPASNALRRLDEGPVVPDGGTPSMIQCILGQFHRGTRVLAAHTQLDYRTQLSLTGHDRLVIRTAGVNTAALLLDRLTLIISLVSV